MTLDDETLMAFVDGELDEVDADRVQRMLDRSSELRARAKVFHDSHHTVRAAFEGELDAPVPARLLELLAPARSSNAAPAAGGPSRLARWFEGWMSPPSLAVAVAVLLCIGMGAGVLVSRVLMAPPGHRGDGLQLAEGSEAWNRGFDQTLSGEAFSLHPASPAVEITPVATFMDARDRYCRAFRHRGASIVQRHGVVCREETGGWRAVVVVLEMESGTTPDDGEDYRPASGDGGGALDRLMESYMTTSPFDRNEEQALVQRQWRSSR